MKSIITECRVDKSILETFAITREQIKRDLAVKAINKMPFEELEKLFNFIEKDMKEDPEFMHFHPDSELVHFAAKIYLKDGTI